MNAAEMPEGFSWEPGDVPPPVDADHVEEARCVHLADRKFRGENNWERDKNLLFSARRSF